MRFELPKFKRCCCCAPLRYGLIVWGYVKLILIIALMLLVSANLYIIIFRHTKPPDELFIYIISAVGIYCIVDGVFIIIMLVGAHKKNQKLLKIYFVYSLISLLVCTFLYIVNLVLEIYAGLDSPIFWLYVIENASFGFFYLLLNLYLVMLLRSEILKLSDNSKFQFVNNAVEAECTMSLEIDETTNESLPNSEEAKTEIKHDIVLSQ